MNFKSFILLGFLSLNANAHILIGSFDSQFDLSHEALKNKVWVNPLEIPGDGIDNDNNGYIDDIHGWNFGDDNNVMFDRSPTEFPEDLIVFAETHMRRRAGTATEEELVWLKDHEARLMPFWGPYVSYMHGTGSASVNVRDTKYSKFVCLRIDGKDDLIMRPPVAIPEDGQAPSDSEFNQFKNDFKEEMYQFFARPIKYAASIGVRFMQMGIILDYYDGEWVRKVYFERTGKVLNPEQAKNLDREYLEYLLNKGGELIAAHPEILFLLPAGNGSDNLDELMAFPQGVRLPNVINVGASIFKDKMAPYSNFGKATVDALIPTVNVYEAVPDHKYMMGSATSISVLLVTNLAALILEENPKLTNLEIRKIILETVITRSGLEEVVVTGGIIYSDRALEAARNSRFMSVDKAIQRSFNVVQN